MNLRDEQIFNFSTISQGAGMGTTNQQKKENQEENLLNAS